VNKQDPFTTVILDMVMPEMDGETLGQEIKQVPELANTILIMLTSMDIRGDASRLEAKGFAGYITKPVRHTQLLDCLATVTGTDTGTTHEGSPSTAANPSLAEGQKPRLRILVVDDDETNRLVAAGSLKQLGFSTDTVASGQEAIQALEKTVYDLVLMDIQMPGMDGWEATTIIRDPQSAVRDHQVTIIAMTAHAMKEDRELCLKAGMDDYVSKPVDPRALMQAIEKQASQSGLEAESEPESPRLPQQNEVFDKVVIMRRLGDNEDLLRQIINVFLESLPDQLEELKQGVGSEDAAVIRQKAHRIKGASASIGAEAVRETAAALEEAGKKGELKATLPLLEELQQEIENLRSVLSEDGLI